MHFESAVRRLLNESYRHTHQRAPILLGTGNVS